MKLYLIILLTIISAFGFIDTSFSNSLGGYLFPQPRQVVLESGKLAILSGRVICPEIANPQVFSSVEKINETLKNLGIHLGMAAVSARGEFPAVKLTIDSSIGHKQGYLLKIDEKSISITGNDVEGLYYGALTFEQIGQFVKNEGFFPLLSISDWPDFERRGVMLDISRDKVPTMHTIYDLVDLLASWKINELQLYTEHTFAYKNHKVVWENASPMTATQIIALNAYCKKLFIDLVPNQNSFGHMKRWLMHDKYAHLADCPNPVKTIWGMSSLQTLSPADSGSFKFMGELYDELLPNFTSKYFNIGCDETVELGLGRSKKMCENEGKGKVYLDFLKGLRSIAKKDNKRVMFWGDIILHHPDQISFLPKDMIPLIWGYSADAPFSTNCPKFQKAGFDYYVVPGTSSWNSILGRDKNAFDNLLNAAQNGKKYNAKGYLITNWGDGGHWQPLSVSYPAFLYGAALSWAVEENEGIDIARILNKQVFYDRNQVMGKVIINLGNAYLKTGCKCSNRNTFDLLLKHIDKACLKNLSVVKLKETASYIRQQIAIMEKSQMGTKDAQIIKNELNQAANLCLHACKVGIYKMEAKDGKIENIPEERQTELYKELKALITHHQELWLVRNRPGGLEDSTKKLEKLLDELK